MSRSRLDEDETTANLGNVFQCFRERQKERVRCQRSDWSENHGCSAMDLAWQYWILTGIQHSHS